MKIEKEKFFKALGNQDCDVPYAPLRPPPKEYLKWINGLFVPLELKQFLLETAISLEYPVGTGTLLAYDYIVKEHEGAPFILRDGFFVLGHSSCGDPIAIMFKEQQGATGYINHETMWDMEYNSGSTAEHFVKLCNALNLQYLIAVGHALAHYGPPRYIGDIDIFLVK